MMTNQSSVTAVTCAVLALVFLALVLIVGMTLCHG